MRTQVAALLVAAAAFLGTGTADATGAADICDGPADPCELSKEVTVTAGSVLDFGLRAFVIKAPSGRLQIETGDILAITAGSMTIESGPGGRLRTAPGSDGGCVINVETMGDFELVRTVGQAAVAIDLSSNDAYCELHVIAGGNVILGADIRARGTGFADGGIASISAGGSVTASGSIEADGAVAGGLVEIGAAGSIDIGGTTIDVSGTEIGFGVIDLITESNLTIGTKLDLRGKGLCADGGLLNLSAGGDLTITGEIDGSGSGAPGFGCLGAEMRMDAGKSVIVDGPIDASGGSDGEGGFFDVVAGVDVVQNAAISVRGKGQSGVGGEASIRAARLLHLGALFDLNGGSQGGGGILRAEGGEGVEIAGEVRADGADFGTLAFVTAPESELQVGGRITVTGNVHARSTVPEFDGEVVLEACQIEVTASGRIETSGQGSRNLLRAGDTMSIAGTLQAGAGKNELQHRDPSKPPQIAGSVTPPPVITSTPPAGEELRPCPCTLVAGDPGVLCADDGNPCTQELCDLALGCTRAPLAGEAVAGCEDGNVCNGRESCVNLACTPGTAPVADDGDPCTDDGACDPVAGYARTTRTGFGAAACRMERIDGALASAAPGEILVKASKKIGKLARSIRSLVEDADAAAGKRRGRLLKAAAKKVKKLERMIASPKSGITANLAQVLTLATTEARATLSQLSG